MVNKKQNRIIIVIAIIILVFLLLRSVKKEDIQITAKFYDKDGNLVGQQRAFKKPVIPTMSFTCAGDTCTSDTVTELDSEVVAIAFSIDLTNTGNLPVNVSYIIETEPLQYMGEMSIGGTIGPISTSTYNIESFQLNTDSQLNIEIKTNFADRIFKDRTYIWKFKRIPPPSEECYQETTNGININDGSCSLDYTGWYQFGGREIGSGELVDEQNARDGDWNTYAYAIHEDIAWIKSSYSVPAGALSSSLWHVKDGAGERTYDIPSVCWDDNEIIFMSYMYSHVDRVYYYCYRWGDSWGELMGYVDVSTPRRIYEEGMMWDIGPFVQFRASNLENGYYDVQSILSYNPSCDGSDLIQHTLYMAKTITPGSGGCDEILGSSPILTDLPGQFGRSGPINLYPQQGTSNIIICQGSNIQGIHYGVYRPSGGTESPTSIDPAYEVACS